MDCSSCGFDRARSRPAKTIKGSKKAAYYPKTQHSPSSLALRLASPLFLPAASSYNEALTVALLDKVGSACAEVDAACPDEGFCHVAPRLSFPPFPPHPPISFCVGTAPKFVGGAAAEEERDASSALGSGEVCDDDMNKATRAAIARAYEVDGGSGGGERGKAARAGAEAGAVG
jgi:hypothetical protein